MRNFYVLMVAVFAIGCASFELNDTLTVAKQVAHDGLVVAETCYVPCHSAKYPYLPGVMDLVTD